MHPEHQLREDAGVIRAALGKMPRRTRDAWYRVQALAWEATEARMRAETIEREGVRGDTPSWIAAPRLTRRAVALMKQLLRDASSLVHRQAAGVKHHEQDKIDGADWLRRYTDGAA